MTHRIPLLLLAVTLLVPSGSTAEPPDDGPAATALRAPSASDLPRYAAGIPGKGRLYADIVTSAGTIACELYEDAAPVAVANFVGLARGLHPWLDATSKRVVTGTAYYDDLTFHRVIEGFVIQAGDRSGTGNGGPGYEFANEIDPSLEFRGAGVLGMAHRGPNTNGSQFFITLDSASHLDRQYTVFGRCDPTVVLEIGSVPVETGPRNERSKPVSPVVIQKIRFERHE